MNVSGRHVFEILRRVCESDRPIGAAELHQRLKLPATTIHRAVASLEDEGFIARYRGQPKYLIGPNPQHLAHALFNLFPLRAALHDSLRKLAVEDEQTVLLTMRLGWYGLKVAVLEGTNQVFHAGAVGETQLMISDGAGQAMLAAMDRVELRGMRAFLDARWPGTGRHVPAARSAAEPAGGRTTMPAAYVDADGWAWYHLPIIGGARGVVAALSAGAPADAERREAGNQRARNLAEAVSGVEALIRDQPELAWSPFEHVAPDDIVLGAPDVELRAEYA